MLSMECQATQIEVWARPDIDWVCRLTLIEMEKELEGEEVEVEEEAEEEALPKLEENNDKEENPFE